MKVYIVTPDFAEATRLAQRYELGPREWRYVHSYRDLMGASHPQVIQSNCFGLRNVQDYPLRLETYQQLGITQARVAIVPCWIDRED